MVGGSRLKLPERLRPLAEFFSDAGAIAVALSGGIDSRFLCHAALLCGADVLAAHVAGPHIPAADTAWAIAWAKECGLRLQVIHFNPLASPAIASNTKERCYQCKKGILSAISACVAEKGEGGRVICDGSNRDDQNVFRPGMAALAEAGVRSPLAEAGLDKAEIRRLAAETGLACPDQPSRPCLLTRFAYNMTINAPNLALVERLEEQIKTELAPLSNPPDFRLRFLPRPVLHLTAPIPEHEAAIMKLLAQNGLPHCSLEVTDKISGYFDRIALRNCAREIEKSR